MKLHRSNMSLILGLAAALGISACGKEVDQAEVSRNEALNNSSKNQKLLDLLEQQRSTALLNAQSNSATYFALNPRFTSGWKTIQHTDDYISSGCPQGSGWAWASMMKVEGKEIEKNKVWCSTSSASVGCFIDADFVKGPYAAQGTQCNKELPYPLKPFK